MSIALRDDYMFLKENEKLQLGSLLSNTIGFNGFELIDETPDYLRVLVKKDTKKIEEIINDVNKKMSLKSFDYSVDGPIVAEPPFNMILTDVNIIGIINNKMHYELIYTKELKEGYVLLQDLFKNTQ